MADLVVGLHPVAEQPGVELVALEEDELPRWFVVGNLTLARELVKGTLGDA